MCIAIPYKVVSTDGHGRAQIEVGGKRQEIDALLTPELQAGDYVLVYLGSAITKIEEQDAMEVLRLYQQIADVEYSATASLLHMQSE